MNSMGFYPELLCLARFSRLMLAHYYTVRIQYVLCCDILYILASGDRDM